MSKDEQIAFLKTEKEQLSSEKEQLSSEKEQLSIENIDLKFQLTQLKKLIYGTKSERQITTESSDQLNLFGEDIDQEDKEVELTSELITYTRSKKKNSHPGRHPLPSHLPVEEVVIEPEQDTKGLIKISEEISDTLDYTPASLVIRRTIRPRYAKAEGQGVIIADLPSRALPKSIAESSLLTHIIVSKFINHLPFYRQIQGFKRDYDWKLSSSTINDWFIQTCTLLEPLYIKMKKDLLSSSYMQADESPIKVLDNNKKGKTHQGYQWVYHSPEKKIIVFNYRKGRGMHGPKEFLSGYNGILQCDGYTVYDKIGKSPSITLAGCLVHARRKYVEAKDNDEKRSLFALDLFKRMYEQENKAKQSDDRKEYRDKHIKPILLELRKWIDEQCVYILPKSPIGKAMSYTISQWDKLIAVFDDARIELDNNLIENKIRPLALGRKNYLFAGSHDSGQRIAMIYSFFATCKANDVNPTRWLKYTLDNIAQTSIQDLEKLLPNNFEM